MADIDEINLKKNLEKHPLKGEHLRTGRVPYPKHVWSPAGGWYAQPANWRMNTAIAGLFIFGLGVVVFNISARLENRPRMPEPDAFYPSRHWAKQIIEHERKQKELKGES
ncbi:hypothetical protein BT63DRAFT_457559 [Microthyrium microscopicum]|uniref:Uncharacterized protein n=1 Tax=Microthyrium microscopicum TaxID=703497 RepID=A0A6A6U674_9PEZI|nr:hypothetical protein BT63DRAFT_457559 [Microthyrium microscopicum]